MYLCSILTLIFTTMAIVKNFWLKGSKKRLGGAVLYQAMGQTRARELASEVTNPRTEAQMSQRIKWSNLVNFYRGCRSWMKYAYENKTQTQSEYNKFMSLNVTQSRIALTKQAAASGAAVADAYILTQGSLPSIEWSSTANDRVSNIYTQDSFDISESTTVGEFARVLINNNPAIQEGDQLSFIRVSQMVNASTGYPYIIVRAYEVLLNPSSNLLLNDYLPVEFIFSENIGEEYTLNVRTTGRKGGFCMILSRTIGGKTYVSSQSLVIVNNEDVISEWSSSEAIARAIQSYGESTEAFLSSGSANTANVSPIGNSIVSAILFNQLYYPNAAVPTILDIGESTATLLFSDEIASGAAVSAPVVTLTDGTALAGSAASVVNGRVQLTLPESPEGKGDLHIYRIGVTVDGTPYTIQFASANVYTIEGLE